jgi:trans-aconitate methyltransferase
LSSEHQYQWNPADYRESSSEQQRWARELLPRLRLQGNERLLDIGCGDGKVTAEIATELPLGSVVGVDSAGEMISYAQSEFPPERFTNLTFMVMDARELNFAAEFDVIFSNATLHWVTDHISVLEGIKRSLRPSGRVVLQMGGRGNAAEVAEAMKRVMENPKWVTYFADFSMGSPLCPAPYGFYEPTEYRAWLDKVGLKAKRVDLVPKIMSHAGSRGLGSWIRTTWLPYTQRIPEALRDEFIDEVVQAYIENGNHSPSDDGLVKVQMMRLEVEAETD